MLISREGMKKRKKYIKDTEKFNWKITKTPIPKPIYGAQPTKPPRIPEKDDKEKWHFIYHCKKVLDPVMDTDLE